MPWKGRFNRGPCSLDGIGMSVCVRISVQWCTVKCLNPSDSYRNSNNRLNTVILRATNYFITLIKVSASRSLTVQKKSFSTLVLRTPKPSIILHLAQFSYINFNNFVNTTDYFTIFEVKFDADYLAKTLRIMNLVLGCFTKKKPNGS